jgi:hypothetical protein
MKRTLSLRIASAVSLLFAAGHTLGGSKSWSPIPDNDVFRAMKSFRFDVGGMSRTYVDFYVGLGYCLAVFLFLQAIVLWQLASLAKKESLELRPLIGSFFVASLLVALLSWKYILLVPVLFSAVIAVFLALALLRGSPRSEASSGNRS